MRTKTNSKLYSYWNQVRGTRTSPRRFDIEPAQIADILSETFILEFQPPNGYQYRLAGTQICENFGRELRGTNFTDGWQDYDRFSLQRHLTSIRKLGAVARILMEGTTRMGIKSSFEILILPLRHNGEDINRFLGAIVPIEDADQTRLWPIVEYRIVETELTYPADGFEDIIPEPVEDTQPQPQPPILAHFRNARIVKQDRRQFRVYDGGLSNQQKDT